MLPKEILWVSELWIYILKFTAFAFILSYIYMCGSGSVFGIRIRIQEAHEYGSNTDPDPQHWFEHCRFSYDAHNVHSTVQVKSHTALRKTSGSGSAKNECGSTALALKNTLFSVKLIFIFFIFQKMPIISKELTQIMLTKMIFYLLLTTKF